METKSPYILHEFYCSITKDKLFIEYYNNITNGCKIHSTIREILRGIIHIDDYLLSIPDLFSKLNLNLLLETYKTFSKNRKKISNFERIGIICLLQAILSGSNYNSSELREKYKEVLLSLQNINIFDNDLFEQVLNYISPFIEKQCTCVRLDNLGISDSCHYFTRLDIIEKIIWETKLNDFYYFANIMKKIKLVSVSPSVRTILPCKINKFNEEMICRILDYFQYKVPINRCVYIYNNRFIIDYYLLNLKEDNLTVNYIALPEYCFICEKLDIQTNYDILRNNDKYEHVKTETYTPVRGYACNNCKEKIINILDIKHKNNKIYNMPLINNNNKKPVSLTRKVECENFIKSRRIKHILVIMAGLFDGKSLFALFPVDIIGYIILSIYWNPFNAVLDESLYVEDNGELLYSQFRSVFGVKSG